MRPNEVTALLLIITLFAAGMYDIAVLFLYGVNATISAVIIDWSQRFILLPYLAGFIMGHIFFPGRALPIPAAPGQVLNGHRESSADARTESASNESGFTKTADTATCDPDCHTRYPESADRTRDGNQEGS